MSGLVYAFVARDRGTVLAEHAALAGNFRSVGVECLSKGTFSDERFTVTADGYTFNFLLPPDGLAFLAVADEAYGRAIPFAFLERLRDAFAEKYGDRGLSAAENSLIGGFGPIIQRQMAYCAEHPEEVSKMAAVQRKVDEVKSIMMQNVEQVLVRGERLDVLVDRTDDLRDQAARFQKQGTQLRKRMWWQNFRMKIIVAGVVVLLVLVIFLLACFTGGRNCVSTGGGGGGGGGGSGSVGGVTGPYGGSTSSLIPGPPMFGGSTGAAAPPPTAVGSAPTAPFNGATASLIPGDPSVPSGGATAAPIASAPTAPFNGATSTLLPGQGGTGR